MMKLFSIFFKCFICFFVLVISISASSEANIEGINTAIYVSGSEKVATIYRFGGQSQLIIISLSDCSEVRRYNFSSVVNSIEVDPENNNYIWLDLGNEVTKLDLSTGEPVGEAGIYSEDIEGFRLNNNDNYMYVWGKSGLAAYYIKNGIKPVWKIDDTNLKIQDLIVVKEGFFIAEKGGGLIKKSMDGYTLNSYKLDFTVNNMGYDYQTDTLLMATSNGLMTLDSTGNFMKRYTLVDSQDVYVQDKYKKAYVLSNGVVSIFTLPEMNLIGSRGISGNGLLPLNNSFALAYGKNSISVFDTVNDKHVGTVYVTPNATGFLSADFNYYGNEFFRADIQKGFMEGISPYIAIKNEPNRAKACSWAGSLSNQNKDISSNNKNVKAKNEIVKNNKKPSVKIRNDIKKSIPSTEEDNKTSVKIISGDNKTTDNKSIDIADISLSPTTILKTTPPKWVLKNADLEEYSAVKSAAKSSEALKEAKIKLRVDITRDVMKKLLDESYVSEIKDDELKKRFLWNVGAKVGELASKYALQRDVWLSPENTYFILAKVDPDVVKQIYLPVLDDEKNILQAYGSVYYIQQTPFKWLD